MALTTGTKLGPYEIIGALGAGGMGEVYRARDTRLGRDVAVKVLPAPFASDPERLRRFEQEARAASALNHPNILAVYDIGMHDGAPFLVTELLEGETLRERLRTGPLAVRKALDIAIQAVHGISAAHEKGIIHRDLKPANIFITNDGRVKILDFGLAKLTQRDASGLSDTQSPTRTVNPITQTEAGVVLGTAGYMSPEQVRGKPADARSDIFALGTILYETLSGQRAFEKDSSADTMAAILKEEPPELSGEGKKIPPAVEHVVRHCLEKNPAERFQSARDLAFHLQSLSDLSTTSAPVPALGKTPPRKRLTALIVALIALAVGATGEWLLLRSPRAPAISYRPMSFQPEAIFNARFAPDGATVVSSVAAEGNKPGLFVQRPGAAAGQSIGLEDVELLSVSSRGELAVLTDARYLGQFLFAGTLAEMPIEGGAPRGILQNVEGADWAPDGSGLAVIRDADGESRLEYPVGKVLYETAGYLSDLRFSPRGDEIAFFEHPVRYDDRGSVDVVNLQGQRRVLSAGYQSLEGLAWAPAGNEVFFAANLQGTPYMTIFAVSPSGAVRKVLASVGDVRVLDASANGKLLVTEDEQVEQVMALAGRAEAERNLSWLDFSNLSVISADGKQVLFTESSGVVGQAYALCLRQTDGSPLVQLGSGRAADISRDDAWALSVAPGPPMRLVLYPTGAGEKRVLDAGNIQAYESAQFFPNGKHVLECGNESGRATRCYVQDISGGPPRSITPEGTSDGLVSPDGKNALVRGAEGKYLIYPVAGGAPRPVPWLTPDDVAIRWSLDGRSVLSYKAAQVPARVERVDLSSGRRTLVKDLAPADRTGIVNIFYVSFSDSEKSYAYSFTRILSRLARVEGVK
jgi:eukaryotic-like serine/threonine-protein kinase